MLVVRNAKPQDTESLYELIGKSELGLTTLTISRAKLESRIEDSTFAFQRTNSSPTGQPYVFVMEDLAAGKIVGTSAIYSKVGGFEPFYCYEIKDEIHESNELGAYKSIPALHLRELHDGPTEIGSLFLAPEYWGKGYGKLLSLSRFLFIAEFPQRFEDEVIAELRGVVESDGRSPLWSAVGSHFFQIEFPKAETLTSESKKFIGDLMPRHPIYIPLLPNAAQEVIGKVHKNTRPAKAMLLREGFQYRNIVDIFDGGPAVSAATQDIRAIKRSLSGQVVDIAEQIDSDDLMVLAHARLDFRCCLGTLAVQENGFVIDQLTALRLDLKMGDRIRAVTQTPSNQNEKDK